MKKTIIFAITAVTIWGGQLLAQEGEVATPDEGWGTLTGHVLIDAESKIPEPKPEAVGDNPDKAVCLVDGEIPADNNIVINPKNNGLRDVVVMMYLKKNADRVEAHPSYDEKKEEPVVLDNVKCRFVPHFVFVRPGQKMILKNSDSVGHNCHITTFKNEHNLNLPANSELELVLENEDKAPGKVTCDLHKWMDSAIFVRENPYVTSTDADGKFVIENIPPGEWEFQFWHRNRGYMKKLQVADGRKVGRKGNIEVKIEKDAINDLGELKIAGDEIDTK